MNKNKAQSRTRDYPEEEFVEMTEAQREAICYKSKLLNKYFDDYKTMKAEEDAYTKAHEAELKAKAEKKEMADAIEVALKEYYQVCNAADKRIKEVSKEENEKILKAKQVYLNLKHDFIEKYGAFHMTYNKVNDKEEITINDLFEAVFKGFPFLG